MIRSKVAGALFAALCALGLSQVVIFPAVATVSTETRKAGPYAGNDVATSFAFAFKVFNKADLLVTMRDSVGAESTLVLDSDYSVSLNANQDSNPGGSITYPISGTPLPTGSTLTIDSDVANTQGVDLLTGGPFLPNVIENGLDRGVILSQQIRRDLDRAIRQPRSDEDVLAELPIAASRANTVLGFDSNGALSMTTLSISPLTNGFPAGTVSAPGLFVTGDSNTGIYAPAADTLAWVTAGGERFRSNSSGRTIFGGLAADLSFANPPKVQIVSSVGSSAALGLGTFAVSTSGPQIYLGKSRGGSLGSYALVGSGDEMGMVQFLGADGTDFAIGAQIEARSDGTPGNNDMPGRLMFSTSADGTQSPTERLRITNDGTVLIGTTTDSAAALDVNGVLRHNGTQAYWLKGITTFTSGSGTYTVPTGVRAIKVRMAGGGGGGGYARAITAANAKAAGGGGAGGAFTEFWLTGLSASYSYGVGAAGAGGIGSSSTAATNGGNTTFSTFTANGGEAGDNALVSAAGQFFSETGASAAPAANAGSHINIGTSNGIPAWNAGDAANGFHRSGGGSNPLATGGESPGLITLGVEFVGEAGSGCGAGGGGAGAWRDASNLTPSGGAGTAGCIIIEEYF